MAKHVNHFDVQDKVAFNFNKTSKHNENDEDDLSLKAQLEREAERKQQKRDQPKQQPKQQRRFAGWVVVKRV